MKGKRGKEGKREREKEEEEESEKWEEKEKNMEMVSVCFFLSVYLIPASRRVADTKSGNSLTDQSRARLRSPLPLRTTAPENKTSRDRRERRRRGRRRKGRRRSEPERSLPPRGRVRDPGESCNGPLEMR